ncbi:uncharacterized protein [Spinacia oleracea]|uniref:Reverse transcriptase/retrotransposon-derived protein RNase H-like domain-containing protein n=1 Tax=Spinacia oleracea TaxID=3562 RepID=A0ABM3RPP0_SPIOL|nr:uncharacterized protein LOC130471455 [Spinacia oleracea]
MDMIHLDDNQNPCIQPQRRMNPIMQDVVKVEVIKLLDASIVYVVSDSKWVSSIQIKHALISSPIILSPEWDHQFEIMCDASDYAVVAVLGQRKDKVLHAIYYASKTLDEAQEFNLGIHDKKGAENVVAEHMPRLRYDDGKTATTIDDSFPDDHLLAVTIQSPWFADYENYIVGGTLPADLTDQQKKKFLHHVRFSFWDDPHLFLETIEGLYKRCVPEWEVHGIINQCHSSPYGGHHGPSKTHAKLSQWGFY